MKCNCQDWIENIEKVNAPLLLASARSGGAIQYNGKRFKFCPWCSIPLADKERKEGDATCQDAAHAARSETTPTEKIAKSTVLSNAAQQVQSPSAAEKHWCDCSLPPQARDEEAERVWWDKYEYKCSCGKTWVFHEAVGAHWTEASGQAVDRITVDEAVHQLEHLTGQKSPLFRDIINAVGTDKASCGQAEKDFKIADREYQDIGFKKFTLDKRVKELESQLLSALAAIENIKLGAYTNRGRCLDCDSIAQLAEKVDLSLLHQHDAEVVEKSVYLKCAKCGKPTLRYSSTIDGLRCQNCGVAYLNCEQVEKREAHLAAEVRKPLVDLLLSIKNRERGFAVEINDMLARVKEKP